MKRAGREEERAGTKEGTNLAEGGAAGERVEPRRPVEEGRQREVGVALHLPVPVVEPHLRPHPVTHLLHLHHPDRAGRPCRTRTRGISGKALARAAAAARIRREERKQRSSCRKRGRDERDRPTDADRMFSEVPAHTRFSFPSSISPDGCRGGRRHGRRQYLWPGRSGRNIRTIDHRIILCLQAALKR